MDRKRFIIAIILSVIVMAAWPAMMRFLNPRPPIPPPPAVNQQPETPEPQGDKAAMLQPESPRPSSPPLPTTNAPERLVTVKTRFWTVALSSRGAVATSWMVDKYVKPDGSERNLSGANSPELQLVPTDKIAELGAPLRLRTPWSPDLGSRLDEANFHIEGVGADQSTVELTEPGSQATITFVYSSPEVVARKTFTFYADRFVFDAAAEVTRQGQPQPVELVIGPRMGDQSDRQSGSYTTPHQVIAYDRAGDTVRVLGPQITPKVAEIEAIDAGSNRIVIDEPLHPAADSLKLLAKADSTFIAYARVVSRQPDGLTLNLDALPRDLQVGDQIAQATDIIHRSYRWVGVVDHYFAMVAVSERQIDSIVLTNVRLKTSNDSEPVLDYLSLAVPIHAATPTHIFVGPKDRDLIAQVGTELGTNLDSLIDYGMFAFAIRPVIPMIEGALNWSADMFGNYGWGIVLVTMVINLALAPLRFYSSKKMKAAAKHQPKMKELQDRMKKLKENPKKNERELQAIQREQMDLMKEANPLGGCLPLLLQMPIFWAFFVYLTISLDVRHAGWIFWINDLSTPDPYKILPIIMCVTMIGSTMLQPMPPSTDPAMKMQRIMMTWLMPIMLTWFFFFSAPSGLVLYWMVSNVAGVVIQLGINKLTAESTPQQAPEAKPETPKPPKKGKSRQGEGFPSKRSSEA